MRPAWLLTGIALVLAWGVTAHAQNVLYSALVSAPEAEVRCGPSLDPKMYPTNRLEQGETVQVVEDQRSDGWLAIKPPHGSFSWINVRFLQKVGPSQWSVENDVPVPVFFGSQLLKAKPSVVSVQVRRGTIVVSIGEPQTTGQESLTGLDGTYLPIEPPPTEKRYIRADAVQRVPFVQTASSKPSTTPSANAAPPPLAATAAQPARTLDPLWLQAQRAEQEGKIEDAEQLYAQLAGQTPDHDLAIACQNRIRSLYELKQSQRPGGPSPVRLTNAYPLSPGTDSRLVPTPAGPYTTAAASPTLAPPGRALSQYCYVRDVPPPAGQVTSLSASSSPPLRPVPGRSGPGWLRRTGGWYLDNKPAYALEADQRGQLRLYVTAGPGVDLEPHIGKHVELYGSLVYHKELRTNYMTVTQVVPLALNSGGRN